MKLKKKILIILFFCIISFLFGFLFSEYSLLNNLKQNINIFYNKTIKLNNDNLESIEVVNIEIDIDEFDLLKKQRNLALKIGNKYRVSEDFSGYQKCRIFFKGDTIKSEIKLKGGQLNHWEHPYKWSFKIKTKGEKLILGLKKFALQKPESRGYLDDWFLHKLLKYHGLINLKFDFVKLIINGKDYGIYNIEENMDYQLLVNNNLNDGSIFNCNTDYMWMDSLYGVTNYFLISELHSYLSNKDSIENIYFQKAVLLFENFRNRTLSPSNVFDTEKLAKFFAIIDLTGHHHASFLYNLKFYYNPETNKIEPIGYDNSMIEPFNGNHTTEFLGFKRTLIGEYRYLDSNNKNQFLPLPQDWYSALFSDYEFQTTYIQALKKISSKNNFEGFLNSIETEYKYYKALSEYYFFPHYFSDNSLNILNSNREYIKFFLNSEIIAHAYLQKTTSKNIEIRISNNHSLPIEIKYLINGKDTLLPKEHAKIVQAAGSILHSKRSESIIFDLNEEKLEIPEKLKIAISNIGQKDQLQFIKVFPYPVVNENSNDSAETFSSLFDYKELNLTLKNNHVFIKGNNIEINKNIYIPSGYIIHGLAGQNFTINNAILKSESPFIFKGLNDSPFQIILTNENSKLEILNTEQQSIFTNCKVIDNSENGNLENKLLIKNADANFYECQFISNNINLSLNTINSTISFQNCDFFNTNIESHFSKNQLANCNFENSKNYISNTISNINNSNFNNPKGVSIKLGNGSYANIENSAFTNCDSIMLCEKSFAHISKCNFTNNNKGLTSVSKDNIPSKLVCQNLNWEPDNNSYLRDEISSINVNLKSIGKVLN